MPSTQEVAAARRHFVTKRGNEAITLGLGRLSRKGLIAQSENASPKAFAYGAAIIAGRALAFGVIVGSADILLLPMFAKKSISEKKASRDLSRSQIDRHRFSTALRAVENAIARVTTLGKDALLSGELTESSLAEFLASAKAELALLGERPEAQEGDTGAVALAHAKIALRLCEKHLTR